MLDTKVVQITGRGTNVNFVIDDSASIDEVTQELRGHLSQHRSLYSRGSITVNVGKRLLEREELTRIKEILEKESGVTVSRFWCPPQLLEEALSESVGFGVSVSPSDAPAADDGARSQARETRKASYQEETEGRGLEQWVAYVLDRPSQEKKGKKPEVATVPAEPAEPELVEPPEVQEEPVAKVAQSPASSPSIEKELEEEQTPPLSDVEESAEESTRVEAPDPEPPAPEAAVEQPVVVSQPGPARQAEQKHEAAGPYRNNETLLIKTTCRSGEVIRYPGDVVVLADVNPGAQVIADGDILVFGSLRGLAHAGAGGDIQATIIAMSLETHRLQIGPYTGVAPKSNKRSKSNKSDPRIAFVRRRSVYVAPYAGRFAGYSGGTLYDG